MANRMISWVEPHRIAKHMHRDHEMENRMISWVAPHRIGKHMHRDHEMENRLIIKPMENRMILFPFREEPHSKEKYKHTDEQRDYENACKLDPDVKNFDDALRARTEQVINAVETGTADGSSPLESLKAVTDWLCENDCQVQNLILKILKDICSNNDLKEVVMEYFSCSRATSKAVTELQDSLTRPKDHQFQVKLALHHIAPEKDEAQRKKGMEKLLELNKAEDPLNEFIRLLKSIIERHDQMLKKLKDKRCKLERQLQHVKVWQIVSNTFFAVASVTVLICSVMAAAMTAPPMAVMILAALSVVPLGPLGLWIDSLSKTYQDKMEGQIKLVDTIDTRTKVQIIELEEINLKLMELQSTISSVLRNVEPWLTDKDALHDLVEDIKKKQERFTNQVEDLLSHLDRYSQDLRNGRDQILLKMKKT